MSAGAKPKNDDLARFSDPRGVFLGGSWHIGAGEPIEVIDPSTEETATTVMGASQEQVESALAAARSAQRLWAETPAFERGKAVRRMADVLRDNADELARILVHEVGKPYGGAQFEVEWSAQYAEYMSEWARRIEGDILPSETRNESIHLMRVPVGVVGAITGWNFPLGLYLRKAAPALAVGNTLVMKPSEVAPLTSIAFTRMIDEKLQLPAGVINLVAGGKETGRALVRSPNVDLVTVTGHRDTGKRIMADAAHNLTRISLELGGKAPAIVLSDADLDLAISELVTARVANSGQVCTCVERIYVADPVYDRFVTGYAEASAKIRVGNPWSDVDIGPLASSEQHAKSSAAVAKAIDQGARIVVGGGKPSGTEFAKGYYFAPTVLADVPPDADIMREEVFGPVTPVTRFTSFEDALELANNSRYGLSAYVFTTDYRTAMRAANEVQFGEIYINRTLGESIVAHHSGWRESGFGGEDGRHGVLRYTQIKAVYHRF